jgi:hypothetical protein
MCHTVYTSIRKLIELHARIEEMKQLDLDLGASLIQPPVVWTYTSREVAPTADNLTLPLFLQIQAD